MADEDIVRSHIYVHKNNKTFPLDGVRSENKIRHRGTCCFVSNKFLLFFNVAPPHPISLKSATVATTAL